MTLLQRFHFLWERIDTLSCLVGSLTMTDSSHKHRDATSEKLHKGSRKLKDGNLKTTAIRVGCMLF